MAFRPPSAGVFDGNRMAIIRCQRQSPLSAGLSSRSRFLEFFHHSFGRLLAESYCTRCGPWRSVDPSLSFGQIRPLFAAGKISVGRLPSLVKIEGWAMQNLRSQSNQPNIGDKRAILLNVVIIIA